MTAPDHLRITGPEDILGFIPHSLGYWPENSLVAMTLQGKRLGATLRVDLPEPGGGAGGGRSGGRGGSEPSGRGSAVPKRRAGSGRRDMLADFARNVVAYLQADDAADGSLLALFTDTDTNSPGGGRAWAGLLKELELALEAAGLPLRDAWLIGPEFWRNAHCDDPECCGSPGRPVEQIRNSRLNAEMVYRGSSVGAVPGAQGTQPASLPVDPAVRAAECGWAEQFSPRRRDRAQFDQVLDVWTMVMQAATNQELPSDSGTVTPEATITDAGTTATPGTTPPGTWILVTSSPGSRLSHFSSHPNWPATCGPVCAFRRGGTPCSSWRQPDGPRPSTAPRTSACSTRKPGPPPGPEPCPIHGSGRRLVPAGGVSIGGPAAGAVPVTEAVPGYGEVLLGLAPSVPDWPLLVRLERVLERLGGLGDGEPTAAAVTARGWIEWCRGRGSYADALYRQALQEHPGYRLAELLAELGRRGTLCGWAARREAAWQKFAPDAA